VLIEKARSLADFPTIALKNSNIAVPSSAALRSAIQLFVLILIGMGNMVGYARLDSTTKHWVDWPAHGLPPKASYQLITYVFLAEATVGAQCAKAMLRVVGTIVGAVLGWVILVIGQEGTNDGLSRDVLLSFLAAAALAFAQFYKAKQPKRAYLYVMWQLTTILVIIWGYDSDGLTTSFKTPYWRILQVLIGCVMTLLVGYIVLPNFDRKELRRNVPKLLHDVGVFYDTAAHYYVDPQLKTFPIEPILTLQAAVQKQTGRIPQTVWEWWPLQESKRHVRNQVKAWQTLGKSLTHSVIVIHAIRLHFVESDWTPPPVLMEHDELREQMIALGAAVLGAHDLMAKLVRRRDGLSPLKLLQNQMSLLSPLLSSCKTKPPFSVDESAAMQSELKRQIDSIRATLDTLRAEVERCWARRGAHRLDETSSDPGAPAAAASQASSYGPAEPFHYVRTTFQFLALTRELVDYLSAAQEGLDRLCP